MISMRYILPISLEPYCVIETDTPIKEYEFGVIHENGELVTPWAVMVTDEYNSPVWPVDDIHFVKKPHTLLDYRVQTMKYKKVKGETFPIGLDKSEFFIHRFKIIGDDNKITEYVNVKYHSNNTSLYSDLFVGHAKITSRLTELQLYHYSPDSGQSDKIDTLIIALYNLTSIKGVYLVDTELYKENGFIGYELHNVGEEKIIYTIHDN